MSDPAFSTRRTTLRIVLTGGPGAGKTEVARAIAARHAPRVVLVPEAATQVYAQLDTRWDLLDLEGRRDVQRRIYRLQVEQEDRLASSAQAAGQIVLLDRGTIDGSAYWPEGPEDYWRDLGTDARAELARYDRIIWLESCAALGLYDGSESNFCRFEDAPAAIRSGEVLRELYGEHPRLELVQAFERLEEKIAAVEELMFR